MKINSIVINKPSINNTPVLQKNSANESFLSQGLKSCEKIPVSAYKANFCGSIAKRNDLIEVKQHFKQVYTDLNQKYDFESLSLYAEDVYDQINLIARKNVTDIEPYSFEKVSKLITNIDEIMAHSKTPCDLKVYRGISKKGFERIKTYDKLFNGIFTDNGFMSTSYNKHNAKDFPVLLANNSGYMLEIILPKGIHAIDINSAISPYLYSNEEELLLARGSRFKVLEIDEKSKTIKMKLISQETPELKE